MRCRVVAHRGGASHRIHAHGDSVADLNGSCGLNSVNRECANGALRIAYFSEERPVGIENLPRVTNLSAALGVERCAAHNQLPRFTSRQRRNLGTVAKEPQDGAIRFKLLVADELGLAHSAQDLFVEGGRDGDLGKGGLLATSAALALFSKGDLETSPVNSDTTLRGEFNGEINREAVGVVQLERNLATERWACRW